MSSGLTLTDTVSICCPLTNCLCIDARRKIIENLVVTTGFNLHAERAKCGQFIGKVDDESPAQLAGLREGDRIVEVNGVNIANENHRQVVERIKGMPTETRLLVVDEAGDKWYKDHKLVIKSTQANVRLQKTPKQRPSSTVTPSASPTASESAEDEKDRSLDEQRLQKEDEVSTIPNGESPSPIVSEDHQPISVSPSLNNNNNNDDDKDVKKTTVSGTLFLRSLFSSTTVKRKTKGNAF